MKTIRKIIVFVLFTSVAHQTWCMEKELEQGKTNNQTTSKQISLELQDGTVVVLDRNLAELSVTLKNILDESEESEEAIPLENITQEQWNVLRPLFSLVYKKKFRQLKTQLKSLSNIQIIQLLKAVNFLDIPDILRAAIRVSAKCLHADDITCDETLPIELTREIIKQRIINERILGVEDKQVGCCRGHNNNITLVRAIETAEGCRIISGSHDGEVYIWDLEGNQVGYCREHDNSVTLIRAIETAEGWRIIAGSRNGTMRIWDLEGNQIGCCRGHTLLISSVRAIKMTEGWRIISGSHDGTVRIWDLEGNQTGCCRGHAAGLISSVRAIETAEGWRIISGSSNGTVCIWDLEGSQIGCCRGHADWVHSVRAIETAEGWRIISGSHDETVCIWDLEGNQIGCCWGHAHLISSVSVRAIETAEGWRIVSDSHDGTVRILDLKGNQLERYPCNNSGAACAIETAEGLRIISGSNTIVQIWDPTLLTRELNNITRSQALDIFKILESKLYQKEKCKAIKVILGENHSGNEKKLLKWGLLAARVGMAGYLTYKFFFSKNNE